MRAPPTPPSAEEWTSEARVVVADGNALTRRGIVAILRDGGLQIVGEATTGSWALQVLESKHPDCLVTADDLPNSEAWNLVAVARRRWPDLAIVALSSVRSDDAMFAALHAGASVYLPKTSLPSSFLAGVHQGLAAPGAFTADDLMGARRRRERPNGPHLTAREHEVLELLAEGLTIADISARLFISGSTVKSHLARIYAKLGAASRTQALMTAVRGGLLSDCLTPHRTSGTTRPSP